MKKIFYILVAAAMAVVACQKQAVEPMYSVKDTDHGTYIFTIKAVNDAADPAVKSDYDASGSFSWSAGDAISVLFHNGDDNKFFTLTTTGTGKSATFSGEITSGYEIGASDGNVSDKKVWALFPASANHTYTAGSNPSFYVQPEVDFTATHFSANIPMYALAADPESGLSFANLACAYKFIVKNLDSSVKKVKLLVSNQTTYGISGLWPIHNDKYINFGYADPGSAKNCITLTANKNGNEAVFYVSCRYWGTFQPNITVYDAETGYTLKTLTASKSQQPTSMTNVQPISISAPGTGNAFDSAFGIDWGAITGGLPGSPNSGNDGIIELKGTATSSTVYLLAKIDKSKLLMGHKYTNSIDLYYSKAINPDPSNHDGYDWKWGYEYQTGSNWLGWTTRESAPYTGSSRYKSYEVGDYYFTEMSYARSGNSFLQSASTSTGYFGIVLYYGKYEEDGNVSGQEHGSYMYAPSTASGMLPVELPGYVAP
ncbi:MAG: hypothetical protein IKO31_01995 [Bacteroidales bacterium]|nr:hypothetical protein [Bacteroidales bacterium]